MRKNFSTGATKFKQKNQSKKFQNQKECHFIGKKDTRWKCEMDIQKSDQAARYQSQHPVHFKNTSE